MKRNHLLNAKVQQVDHLHVLGARPVVRHAQSQAGRIEAQVETLQAHRECGIEWCSLCPRTQVQRTFRHLQSRDVSIIKSISVANEGVCVCV